MEDRRKNHAMRRLIEAVLSDVTAGAKEVRQAAKAMQAVGVPLPVAVRVLAARRS